MTMQADGKMVTTKCHCVLCVKRGNMAVIKSQCALCHRDPALGWALIGEDRYCHGNNSGPSCYEKASWDLRDLLPDNNDDARMIAELIAELRMRIENIESLLYGDGK